MEFEDNVILVVEDERPLAKAIKDLLEQHGFEVVSARNVDQAMDYVDEIRDIKAVWLDHYLLGDKNGLDFLAHVKNNEQTNKIPIFVVTNTGGHDKKQTYMNLGANKYYVKVSSQLGEIVDDVRKELKRINEQK